MLSSKWRPFCLGLNVLTLTQPCQQYNPHKMGRNVVDKSCLQQHSLPVAMVKAAVNQFSLIKHWKGILLVLRDPMVLRDLTVLRDPPVSGATASHINTLRPRQNGGHFPDDIFKCIFLNENAWISIKISLKFVPKGPINKIPALFQIMAWRRSGDKPLSEPMMVSLLTHICVTRPHWVKRSSCQWSYCKPH